MKILAFFETIRKGFEENHKIADALFTIIILFVSVTSFFHVMEYWTLTNKFPFYVITAIATELVIIGSMLAIRYTDVAWVPFILGILVQGIGNIFYSYINIDVTSDYFKSFQELFQPLFEMAYGDELVEANYKRVLAYSNGAFYLSPIVFLWAKMSLKVKVQKAAKAAAEAVASTSSAPTPIIPPSNPVNSNPTQGTSTATEEASTNVTEEPTNATEEASTNATEEPTNVYKGITTLGNIEIEKAGNSDEKKNL